MRESNTPAGYTAGDLHRKFKLVSEENKPGILCVENGPRRGLEKKCTIFLHAIFSHLSA